ncbi:MAG: type II secretion system F family protein [Thermoguttaceae bacterium]
MDEFLYIFLMLASILIFPLGILTLMRARWFTGPAPGDRKPDYVNAIRTFAWFLTIVGFVVGTCLILPGLPILWFASLAVIIAMAYGKQVATQQYAMLTLVGAAAERSMPLETAFAAFGHESGGWMRQRATEIVDMLQHGAPLPAALEAVPGVLPPEAVPLVCVGYENGSLGPAIDQAIAARNLYEPAWQSIVPKIGYICLLTPVAVGIVIFLFLKIIPQYQKIFVDYHTKLPDITLDMISVCCWPLLGLLSGTACLVLLGLFVYGALRAAGAIRWDLPGMDWLLRRRHVATVLDALALAAQRQRPLGEALSTLASSHPQRSIQRRLRAVCDELQAGGDDLQCLHRHGLLGKTDLALLQAARRNGNLAWAAREMADSNRSRLIYRIHALLQVIFPLIIVGYGLLVAAIATAMFLPLVVLIRGLAPL